MCFVAWLFLASLDGLIMETPFSPTRSLNAGGQQEMLFSLTLRKLKASRFNSSADFRILEATGQ